MNVAIYSFESELSDELYNALVSIEINVYNSARNHYDSEPWGIEEFMYKLPCKEKYSYIIRVDNEIVGFSIGYAYKYNWFHISRVAVLNRFQGRGFGYDLLTHQLNEIQTQSPDMISVDLNKNNTSALKLYSSLGFKILSGKELYEYVIIRERSKSEYIGEEHTHLAMAILKEGFL